MHNKKGGSKWLDSHRERLHKFANDVSFERKSVLMPIGTSGQAEIQNISGSVLSEYYMDVAMSGGPWQCDWGDGTCDEMKWVILAGRRHASSGRDLSVQSSPGKTSTLPPKITPSDPTRSSLSLT